MHVLDSQTRKKVAAEPAMRGERRKRSRSAPIGLACARSSFLPTRCAAGSDSGVKSTMIRKLSTPTAAAACIGARRPYLAEMIADRGKPRMKAPATDSPWNTPMFAARRSGVDASATYAWQTVLMHDDTPSTTSARYSTEVLFRAVACSQHVVAKPSAEYAMSGRRPCTSERAPRKPTHMNVITLSSASTSPPSTEDAELTLGDPSGLTIVEITRPNTGMLNPSARK
mmetsp:Transcript_37339/g.64150  ORF Transcript_37339/g.64150 Transcript_37339/m.64150 type:complete len:227 (+) Transcript_37339:709-1389(+)